jgi:uncharacterized protein DUF4440
MRRFLSPTIVILIVAFGLHAQTAPDSRALTRLLNEFLAGASRNDAAVHDRFWAEDLIYTRSAGKRIGKADIMRDVRSAPAPKPEDPKTTYTAEDIRIQQYANTAIIAFQLIGTTDENGRIETTSYLNTGTFLKRNGKWQAVSWQATKIPRQEEDGRQEVSAESAFHQGKLILRDHLIDLEKQSWEAWKNHDGKFFQQFLSDDHVEVGFGGLMNTATVVAGVANPICTVKSYAVDRFELTTFDPNTALLTYYAEQDTSCNGSPVPSPAWVSSLYLKRGGRWHNALYQQTQTRK